MARLSPRQSAILLAVAVMAAIVWAFQGGQTPPGSLSHAKTLAEGGKTVQLEMTIEDPDSGLSVQVRRRVPVGTTALEAMQATVAIETKEYADLGLFVTSPAASFGRRASTVNDRKSASPGSNSNPTRGSIGNFKTRSRRNSSRPL
jgi:hypothetical protein